VKVPKLLAITKCHGTNLDSNLSTGILKVHQRFGRTIKRTRATRYQLPMAKLKNGASSLGLILTLRK